MEIDFETVTLDDLIHQLQQARDEHGGAARVVLATSYGDRGRTMQVHDISGAVERVELKESGYSESGYALRDADDDEMDDDGDESGEGVYLRLK